MRECLFGIDEALSSVPSTSEIKENVVWLHLYWLWTELLILYFFLNTGFSYLCIFCVCMFSSTFAYVCMYSGHLPVYACGRKIKWIPLTLPTLFLRQSLTEPGTCYFDSTDWPGRHHNLPVSFPSPSNGLLCLVLGIQTQLSCLYSKPFLTEPFS